MRRATPHRAPSPVCPSDRLRGSARTGDTLLAALRRVSRELPGRSRTPAHKLAERIEHWLTLHADACRDHDATLQELRFENLRLRFDLEATRRELESLRDTDDSEDRYGP